MASFTFSPINTEDLSTGTYYIHLVNSVPNTNHTTVSQLITSTAFGYVPKILTGLVYDARKWTFDDFTFPSYNYSTIPVGIVVCKQLSTSFNSGDPILYYSDINNVLRQPILLTTGKYFINIKFPNSGLISFSEYYQYSSGNFQNIETIPKGLIYLLGTRNDTLPFLAPLGNSILDVNAEASVNPFNRVLDGITVFDAKYAFNFGSRKIRVGVFGYYHRDSNNVAWTIWGSNTYISGSLDNAADWTSLGSSSTSIAGWNFITCNNATNWQFIKLTCVNGNGAIQEIEFYNSTMISTDTNLMSSVFKADFEYNLNDSSGWNNQWVSIGDANILNNSLFFSSGAINSLTTSLFSLSRNFKYKLDFKINSSSSANICLFNVATNATNFFQLNANIGNVSLGLGSGGSQFYNTGILGSVISNDFNTFNVTRINALITTKFNSNSVTTINSGNISTSNFSFNAPVTGLYLRNFELVT